MRDILATINNSGNGGGGGAAAPNNAAEISGKKYRIKAKEVTGEGVLVPATISFRRREVVGAGCFGIVFRATVSSCADGCVCGATKRDMALKVVRRADPAASSSRKKKQSKELSVLLRIGRHENVVRINYYFYGSCVNPLEERREPCLSIFFEYLPSTLYEEIRRLGRMEAGLCVTYGRQLFGALAHVHGCRVCHRDVKPTNLLVDPERRVLKLCDFGSAKVMVGEGGAASFSSYVCSRYYRAPELLLGSDRYGFEVDVWSAGSVLAEMALGAPLFSGETAMEQLADTFSVLGPPTDEEMKLMNAAVEVDLAALRLRSPKEEDRPLPPVEAKIARRDLSETFYGLLADVFQYGPRSRPTAAAARAVLGGITR